MKKYLEIAISGPLRKTFTYSSDGPTVESLTPGALLSVEFAGKRVIGFYLGETSRPRFKTKEIESVLQPAPHYSRRRFKFYRWLADYYFANPADVLTLTTPPHFTAKASTKIYLSATAERASDRSALEHLPERILRRLRAGDSLRPRDISEIDQLTVIGVRGYLERELFSERISYKSTAQARLVGYRVLQQSALGEQTGAATESLGAALHSDAPISRKRLLDAGLSAGRLKRLVEDNALQPVFADAARDLFKELPVRDGLSKLKLNSEQRAAVEAVSESLSGGFAPYLLHGITGSGKTLVYVELIRRTLAQGRSALFLTPEIALAGETLAYLRGALGDEVGLWHSALSKAERTTLWRKLEAGELRVLVGPRSALFAPLKNPGLVVVDEEHDESYKQDEPSPRFQGRDAAVMFARTLKIPVVLGSGTPSVESYHNAQSGRYTLLELKKRPSGVQAPSISLVDMNSDAPAGDEKLVSQTVRVETQERLNRGEQVILYLNRRGFAPRVRCCDCGEIPHCPDCHSSLTYHSRGEKVVCHLCGFTRQGVIACPNCEGTEFAKLGSGTQRMESSISELFDNARSVRLDSDASTARGAWRILREFSGGKYNLLIGTQMISKGLDLPDVTLAVILAPDPETGMVDFRSDEKSFAKILQVAGRSGRADKAGIALVQTYQPDSELMRAVVRQDFGALYQQQLEFRRRSHFPPFSRIARITLSGVDESEARGAALSFFEKLHKRVKQAGLHISVYDPAPCQLYRLRGRYRYQITLISKNMTRLSETLTEWERKETRFALPTSVRVAVDIDAYDFS